MDYSLGSELILLEEDSEEWGRVQMFAVVVTCLFNGHI